MTDVLHTSRMTVGYHHTPLIRDICLKLHRGQIMTLIGPNGAGKSTILKSITRQMDLLGGTVYLDGTSMADMTGKQIAGKMSVVLTERAAAEYMTCRDVVAMGRYPYTGLLGIPGRAGQ